MTQFSGLAIFFHRKVSKLLMNKTREWTRLTVHGRQGNWLVTMLSFIWENISQLPINYRESKAIQGQFCWNNIGKFITVVRLRVSKGGPETARQSSKINFSFSTHS